MCENVHIAHSLTTLVHKERLFPSHFTNPQGNVDISGIPLFQVIFGRGITLHSLELPTHKFTPKYTIRPDHCSPMSIFCSTNQTENKI